MGDPRSDAKFKRLRAQFRANCERTQAPCHWCGMEIDYSLPDNSTAPDRFNLDHAKPIADFPDLAKDPGNFVASHAGCNLAKGAGLPHPGVGVTSRNWLAPTGVGGF